MIEGDDTSHFLPRIRQELDKLPLTEAQKDEATRCLLKQAAFLDTRGGKRESGNLKPDSAFFDFASKAQAVVQHFQDDGLTLREYLNAAIKQPQLLYHSPENIAANITGVVDRFAADGLTRSNYLQAALKQPALFCHSPETIAAHITGVVDRFADDGLTCGNYLRAALTKPQLFAQSPKTIAANITGVVDRFATEGLTTRAYVKAALKQPSLFSHSPETIAGNIQGVVERFAPEGLTTGRYLSKAALKQPSLFYQSPETIARHISAVLSLSDSRIFRPPTPRRQREFRSGPSGNPSHAAVIDFLLKNPELMSFADDNFAVREVHQRLTDGPTDYKLLRAPRHGVERELMRHLAHDDPQQPIPSDGFVAGATQATDEEAKRFVLRALLHAGYIRSGKMER